MAHSKLTASHWGAGKATVINGKLIEVCPHPEDPAPSPINENIASSLNGQARVLRPSIREGWLRGWAEGNPQAGYGERGRDAFVEVSWEEVLDIIAKEHQRIVRNWGNEAIFAGSYGWSSAGRFHHAQGQLKRFLNQFGGFVRSEGSYSINAAQFLLPHIVCDYRQHVAQATRWNIIAEHSDLVILFGGMAMRNTQIAAGGVARHRLPDHMRQCAQKGVRFVNFSPLKSDVTDIVAAEWLAPKPGSDVAIMMGLAHTLIVKNLHDKAFLDRYTVGFDKLHAYLMGTEDGIAKDADWAAALSGVGAEKIRQLAVEMAGGRCFICTTASLQRTDYGEQALWMTIALASLLGQIGLPGGGYGIGYGIDANVGAIERPFSWASFPQTDNPIKSFIPVAMLAEMLLNPGGKYDWNGQQRTFPDIRLIWWAGGNPFHHHQDLNRLRQAWRKPETIIVNEINWTSTARHSDIILPCSAPQEREDFAAGHSDNALIPMPKLIDPPGEALSEFEIFSRLEKKMGGEGRFSLHLSEQEWLMKLWEETRVAANQYHIDLPRWQNFITGDVIHLFDPAPSQIFLADFRADPQSHSLPTPSGKIELYSKTIASFRYEDCPGHPTWFPPRDVAAGKATLYPLYLLSGQPETRLHSQLDNGAFSQSRKIKGREPVLIHPQDAKARGISSGDIVELFNERGRCLAGAQLSDMIAPGCVFLWTGAWYDPDFEAPQARDKHGNPNVLTHDHRTSRLTQGSAAHSTLVECQIFKGELPLITVHQPPVLSNAHESNCLEKWEPVFETKNCGKTKN